MMAKMVHVGFGNAVMEHRIVAVLGVDSLPIKRLKEAAKERGLLVDATMGRQEKSVIIMDSGHVIVSALAPSTIIARVESDLVEDE